MEHRTEGIGFMDLPTEIRMQIYTIALEQLWIVKNRPYYYNFCSTCRQVRLEALPLILASTKLHQKFENIAKWVHNGTIENLAMIRKLDICFGRDCFEMLEESPRHAADLRKFVPETGSMLKARYGSKFKPHTQDIVGGIVAWSKTKSGNAIATVWGILSAFPNLEHLSLNTSERPHHNLFRPEKEMILEMLPSAFPNLRGFKIYAGPLRILYLGRFQFLQHLTCSGYFCSNPESAVSIFRSLKHLISLTIIQPSCSGLPFNPYTLARDQHQKHLCLTPNLISQLNPLQTLEFNSNSWSIYRVVPFNAAIMKAINTHSNSLLNLKVTQRCPVTHPALLVSEVLSFVSRSDIPDIDIDILLPGSITSAKIDPMPKSSKVVDVLLYSEGSRACLKVKSGKYLPSEKEVGERREIYEMLPGANMLRKKEVDYAVLMAKREELVRRAKLMVAESVESVEFE